MRPSGLALANAYLWDPWFIWDNGAVHMFSLFQAAPPSYDPRQGFNRDHPIIAHNVWSDTAGWQRHADAVTYTDTPYDVERVHTGCIVQESTAWLMYYSGSGRYICLARSGDLETWHKDPANPLISPNSRFYAPRWRDPWIVPDRLSAPYTMLIAAQRPGTPQPFIGTIAVAHSADYLHWEQQNPLNIPPWFEWLEVPELHQIGGTWYLLFATRDRWITDEGRQELQRQGTPSGDGAYCLMASEWHGPFRRIGRLFSANSPRYVTRLVTTPTGERWLWSHVEETVNGQRRYAIAPPLPAEIMPDGRLIGDEAAG